MVCGWRWKASSGRGTAASTSAKEGLSGRFIGDLYPGGRAGHCSLTAATLQPQGLSGASVLHMTALVYNDVSNVTPERSTVVSTVNIKNNSMAGIFLYQWSLPVFCPLLSRSHMRTLIINSS